jgi:transcription termination/antitermination protein NusG
MANNGINFELSRFGAAFLGVANDEPAQRSATEEAKWYVLWTRSNFEQLVYDQLSAKGFELFLPRIGRWSRREGLRYLAQVPMFPGYLFLRHSMSKASYIEVRKARGLVRILGERWDRLGTIPPNEIWSIQRVLGADMPVMPHPYVREGQRVRITDGPLANVEGIVVKPESKKGLLVLSIELLRKSVAVQVDSAVIAPV